MEKKPGFCLDGQFDKVSRGENVGERSRNINRETIDINAEYRAVNLENNHLLKWL